MKRSILIILFLLGMTFGTANACDSCEEIHVVPVQNTLQSCYGSQSETVEVVIHNPVYCGSTVDSITLSDTANFKLNTSHGAVPCASDSFSMRGYQFCTVGVTFKPVTTSGTFQTDISVNGSAMHLPAIISGEVLDCCKECVGSKCDGKITQLTLMNMGVSGQVTVTQKKTNAVIFNEHVDFGAEFTFNGSDDKGTMGTEIYIAAGGVQNVAIHTSCSQTIAPEMIFGNFKVIEGYSRNGGLLATEDCITNDKKPEHKKCEKHSKHNVKKCEKHSKHDVKKCEKHSKHDGKKCEKHSKYDGKKCDIIVPKSCIDEGDIAHVEKLVDPNATNYLTGLNLLNPIPQITVVNNEVVFNNYNEQDNGLATFGLDQTIDFVSMLTFTVNVNNGLFMPRMSGNDGRYMTTDVRKTNQYGFIFPNAMPLSKLDFTTWGVSFTGSIIDLSIIEVTNTNILAKEQQ